jgi:signal transduction histidine kinase
MTLTASVEVLENAKHEMPERSQMALDLLASDIARFRNLVEDLLEISRFDVGTAQLQADPLLYAEFVRAAVDIAAVDNVELVVEPDAEDVIVVAEKRRLARVVANLLDNAAKYGDGEIRVHVSRNGDSVLTAVEDNGPGVPTDERFVIFDRFSRGGAGGRRGYDTGVGLGLSLVAEHVNLHDGRVWVEGRPDGEPGARFVVELPLDEGLDGEFA